MQHRGRRCCVTEGIEKKLKTDDKMRICVVGCGYVGLATTVAIAKNQNVTVYDIDSNRRECLKNNDLPINDEDLKDAFQYNRCRIIVEEKKEICVRENDCFILTLPTDDRNGLLDTSILEKWIEEIISKKKKLSMILIRSTVPVGFTKSMQDHFAYQNIFFWPEFLREGKAFYDIENPSRVVLGGTKSKLKTIIKIIHGNKQIDFPIYYTSTQEAEAIKLFSNAYLAMRISFFNEIDSFSEREELDSQKVIQGVCADSRIGDYYNNPSFGYGGYCLPKDTKQIAYQIADENTLINTIYKSNERRKQEIIRKIEGNIKRVGIYRLQMKKDSDNIRGSATLDIISKLMTKGIEVWIFEPMLKNNNIIQGTFQCRDLRNLYDNCDIILANRVEKELLPYIDKVYTRDLFFRD